MNQTSDHSNINNVLLVTIDCLRYDKFVEAAERGYIDTMSGLTENNVEFESAFTVANATDPSLTSIMTAAYPHTHGVVENGWELHKNISTVAEELNKEGFDTFGVVSVDHLSDEHSGLGRGFNSYHSGRGHDIIYPYLNRIFNTNIFNTVFGAIKNIGVGNYNIKSLLRDLGIIQLHCRPGETVTEDTISEINQVESPFFGWIHYFDMHEPRNFRRDLLSEVDEYTASMMTVDRFISRLLTAIERQGMRDETLIILTGDHGENLNDHGYVGHGRTLYDEEIHVPLIFSHPSLTAQEVKHQVREIDISSTILDILDLDIPSSFEGDSLYPHLFDHSGEDRNVFATAYPEFSEAVAIRSGGFKLIQENNNYELYDVIEDPEETMDLSNKSDYESVQDRLAQELQSWRDTNSDIQEQEIDNKTEEMLEDLGYID